MSMDGVPPIGAGSVGGVQGFGEVPHAAITAVQQMQVKLEDLAYYNHLMSSCANPSPDREFFQNQIHTALGSIGKHLHALNEMKEQLPTHAQVSLSALNAGFSALPAASMKSNPTEIMDFQHQSDELLVSLGA